MTDKVKVEIFKTERTPTPTYAIPGDAGMDIVTSKRTVVHPNEIRLLSTGLRFRIPQGYEIQVRPRSGLSLKTKLRIANSPGTIDSNYRGELKIIVENTSRSSLETSARYNIEDVTNGEEGIYIIEKGTKIAQIVLSKVETMELIEIDDYPIDDTPRGKGGFGHTGVK